MDIESGCGAPNNVLAVEILLRIFSDLHLSELAACALTCKNWHQAAYDASLPLRVLHELDKKNSLIGPGTLKQCIGEIGKVPPLTPEILNELQSPDPQNEGKVKKEKIN